MIENTIDVEILKYLVYTYLNIWSMFFFFAIIYQKQVNPAQVRQWEHLSVQLLNY